MSLLLFPIVLGCV